MGFFSGIRRVVKRVKKPVKKLVGLQVTGASGLPPKKAQQIVTAGVKVAKSTVTGSLDPIGAASAGLIHPAIAATAFPRETLLAGGAVAAGTFLTGASAANAGVAGASKVGSGTVATTGGILGTSLTIDQLKDKAKEKLLAELAETKTDDAVKAKPVQQAPVVDKNPLTDPKILLTGAGLLLSVIAISKGGG